MMLKSLLLALFLLVQISFCSTIPLLDENTSEKSWSLNNVAEEHLMQFQDKYVHIVAVGGPTRAGKSFIMSKILDKFVNNGGQIHFGTFVHRLTMESVTKGMDIALVEYKNKFILLLDCEGLDSVTKDMDPRLMVTMSMIAQKMIYLETGAFKTHTVENISTMISNRNAACDTTGVPLDTMYFILNQYDLERIENFLQEKLNTEEYCDIKEIIDDAFPNQKTFFVSKLKKGPKSIAKFEEDTETIFQHISSNINPFTLKGTTLTIGNFVQYLKGVLENVNSNKQISFPNVLQATYEQFARNKMCELREDMKPCQQYYNEEKLNSRLLQIESKKEDFEQECCSYKNQISDIYEQFLIEFKEYFNKFQEDNEKIGNEIESTEVTTRKEELGSQIQKLQEESGGFWSGAATGISTGCSGGYIGAGIGGVVGGIGGLLSKDKEIKVKTITWAVFQITIITLKNGKQEKTEKQLPNVTTQDEI